MLLVAIVGLHSAVRGLVRVEEEAGSEVIALGHMHLLAFAWAVVTGLSAARLAVDLFLFA